MNAIHDFPVSRTTRLLRAWQECFAVYAQGK